MKKLIKNFLIITIPTIIFLFIVLELFFRFVIPACNPPQAIFDETTRLYRHKANQKGLSTIGKFARLTAKYSINNYVWNSPIDYSTKKTKPRIAIIGDSYIEAFLVDPVKAYPSLLREEIGSKYDVYSFGKSGAPLSQYLQISRYANNTFEPDILIFNVVHNDFDESIFKLNSDIYWLTLEFIDGKIIERPPEPDFSFSQYNWKKRILKKSAIIRYLLINLGIRQTISDLLSNQDTKYNANVEVNRLKKNIKLIKISTEYLLKKIKEENIDKRIIFVMDGPREDIYTNTLEDNETKQLHVLMKELCDKFNFKLIDLTESMKNDYELKKIKFNSEYDGHWNEYGHKFVSTVLIESLENIIR